MSSNNLDLFTLYTLIDITYTGVIREGVNKNLRNQQRNYETILQLIGLRTQPILLEKPVLLFKQDLANYNFGDVYTGNHTVWKFTFGVEYADVFSDGHDLLGTLKSDMSKIPIIAGLDETISLQIPVLSTSLDHKNTYFTRA